MPHEGCKFGTKDFLKVLKNLQRISQKFRIPAQCVEHVFQGTYVLFYHCSGLIMIHTLAPPKEEHSGNYRQSCLHPQLLTVDPLQNHRCHTNRSSYRSELERVLELTSLHAIQFGYSSEPEQNVPRFSCTKKIEAVSHVINTSRFCGRADNFVNFSHNFFAGYELHSSIPR